MNNNYRKQLYAAAFSAVLAGGSGSVFAASAADLETQVDAAAAATAAHQSLQGVVVTGSGNAFLHSDQRLALLNASLPLDAGEGTVQQGGFRRIAAMFPRNPNAADGEARRMMERSQALPSGSDPNGDLGLGQQ